ncbi:hypothetical protein ABHI18_009054 [Aspergillus niger]
MKMHFANFLSLTIAAIVPTLAATDATNENIEASIYPLKSFHGAATWSNGDGSCITSVTGHIRSVKLAPGLTCHIYFEPDCQGDDFPLKGDTPDVIHDHGHPALSARCFR